MEDQAPCKSPAQNLQGALGATDRLMCSLVHRRKVKLIHLSSVALDELDYNDRPATTHDGIYGPAVSLRTGSSRLAIHNIRTIAKAGRHSSKTIDRWPGHLRSSCKSALVPFQFPGESCSSYYLFLAAVVGY
ncbi:hypothetical protein An15g02330 [Aspergillus niger]|uniref:Uncharacterized protein n=2 Tax=Aspergillus niger TaxID=5061 RepID=A2R514_ASPNC|nr:hypothetical protein An15g02330 [Aspergillus niger]CAK42336.1 hypothetical protein An15g02330 [Aspergillus niger]